MSTDPCLTHLLLPLHHTFAGRWVHRACFKCLESSYRATCEAHEGHQQQEHVDLYILQLSQMVIAPDVMAIELGGSTHSLCIAWMALGAAPSRWLVHGGTCTAQAASNIARYDFILIEYT
jgi:hypothetical protein